MSRMFVKSEFATLKKVVVAQSEFGIPWIDDNNDQFLLKENIKKFDNTRGLDFSEAFPEPQIKWEREREELVNILKKYGVDVLRPRLLTATEKQYGKENKKGYSNFFCRDPFFTCGNFIIEGNLRFNHRRQELFPLKDIIEDTSKKSECYYFSTPQIDISQGESSENGPFLEGGDILVYDKFIFVGISGLATNLKGIRWLKLLMEKFEYTVIEVSLHKNVLHLDCAISLVREGLMIVCEEALLNGIPKLFEKWDRINVSLHDTARLMVNGLSINEKVYITDKSFEKISEELNRRGIKIEFIDFAISRSFGGSIRCSTQALLRE